MCPLQAAAARPIYTYDKALTFSNPCMYYKDLYVLSSPVCMLKPYMYFKALLARAGGDSATGAICIIKTYMYYKVLYV